MTWLGRLTRALTWALFGATLTSYLLIVLWSLPLISADAAGLTPFDVRPFGYDLDAARVFLAALGEAGHAQYIGPQALLDRVFPPLLAVFSLLAFWQLYSRKWAVVLGALALVVCWLDLQENVAVADLLTLGAEGIDEEVVSIAALLTMLKSAVSTVTQSALLFGAGRALWRQHKTAGNA